MRVARTINRQTHDEDDVGRAGYVPPVIDQDRCCSFWGTSYSPQHAREVVISAIIGGIISNIAYSSLNTIVVSDLFTFIFTLSLAVGAATTFHKSTAPRINRTPLKALIYKVFAGVTALAAVLAFVLRYELKGYEKETEENAKKYPAGAYTAPAFESSFGGAMSILIAGVIIASFTFNVSVLLCDFYNKTFSKAAIDDAIIDPNNEHGDRGISELCTDQINTVILVSLVISLINGLVFDINKAAASSQPTSSSSFICKHQMLSFFVGVVGGFWVGNANFAAADENAEAAPV